MITSEGIRRDIYCQHKIDGSFIRLRTNLKIGELPTSGFDGEQEVAPCSPVLPSDAEHMSLVNTESAIMFPLQHLNLKFPSGPAWTSALCLFVLNKLIC